MNLSYIVVQEEAGQASVRKPDRLQLHLFLIATITFRITQIKQPKWCNHWEIVEQKTGK